MRIIEEIDIVILRAHEFIKASVVLSLDEELNDLIEVARVPSKRAPPKFIQHFIIFFDNAGAKWANLKLQQQSGIIDHMWCIFRVECLFAKISPRHDAHVLVLQKVEGALVSLESNCDVK